MANNRFNLFNTSFSSVNAILNAAAVAYDALAVDFIRLEFLLYKHIRKGPYLANTHNARSKMLIASIALLQKFSFLLKKYDHLDTLLEIPPPEQFLKISRNVRCCGDSLLKYVNNPLFGIVVLKDKDKTALERLKKECADMIAEHFPTYISTKVYQQPLLRASATV
jgi:hypothetical protein